MSNLWHDLPRPFFILAPMEDVTDTVFRRVVLRAGRPDIFFTEFTNAKSFCHPKGRESAMERLIFTKPEQPLVAQIWGTDPEDFATMSRELARMGFAGIDINMGCPAKDVVKTGACSALIENPVLAKELIQAAKEGDLPVSVKTRIGFRTPKTEEWTNFLLEQDISALTIHARTTKEMSKVPAHWEELHKVVAIRDSIAPQTPIIGNGDIADRGAGERLVKDTGIDGIMIGRGIFSNIFAFEQTPKEHTFDESLALLRYHLDLFDSTWKETNKNYQPLKRFFKIYIKGFEGAAELRNELMNTRNTDEARAAIEAYCK